MERHIADPSTHHLPTIMWAVLMAQDLPDILEEVVKTDNRYLSEAADLCEKTAEQVVNLYVAFDTEEQK